jgi:hypothetical protein
MRIFYRISVIYVEYINTISLISAVWNFDQSPVFYPLHLKIRELVKATRHFYILVRVI